MLRHAVFLLLLTACGPTITPRMAAEIQAQALGGPEDLITNGRFGAGLEGWQTSGQVEVKYTDQGRPFARLTYDGTTPARLWQRVGASKANTRYWIYENTRTSGGAVVHKGLQERDDQALGAAYTVDPNAPGDDMQSDPGDGWQHSTGLFEVADHTLWVYEINGEPDPRASRPGSYTDVFLVGLVPNVRSDEPRLVDE